MARSITAPGKLWLVSEAATASTPVALPGEPVMYAFGPSLLAEATTMTPDAASALLACESASSSPPTPPTDMLITSMGSAWVALYCPTHSRASVRTFVPPSQPNTLRATSLAFGATPGPMRNEVEYVDEL